MFQKTINLGSHALHGPWSRNQGGKQFPHIDICRIKAVAIHDEDHQPVPGVSLQSAHLDVWAKQWGLTLVGWTSKTAHVALHDQTAHMAYFANKQTQVGGFVKLFQPGHNDILRKVKSVKPKRGKNPRSEVATCKRHQ